MDKNAKNQNSDDDENKCRLRKFAYWKKYGVKRFPYRGRRRYLPSINQSTDGGIFISNDVFGLTIKQFERKYKECLERRKIHEQLILNIRYPDKSSHEYLEYLHNCIYYNKDSLPWPGNDIKEHYLYEHLRYAVGTEICIRNRQRLCIINDMMENLFLSSVTEISSGSFGEGLDLPGSDKDMMFLINSVDVIQNVQNIKQSLQNTTLVMELDNAHPGFTRLRLIAENDKCRFVRSECCESTRNGLYLSAALFIHNLRTILAAFNLFLHGPCISDKDQDADFAFCLRIKHLPYSAIPWVSRHRHQWPPNFVIDKIQNYGCLLVPIGPKTNSECHLLWRLSFSMAEKQLVHSFNFTQFLCYGLLKLTLRRIINANVDVKDLLCSYFLKTALFWVSEEVDIEIFQIVRIFYCFYLCLDKLILWINSCYCPNYFIPEHNMFLGKIDKSNNKQLQSVLVSIKRGGIDGLINNLFPIESGNRRLLRTKNEISCFMLDFFVYRIWSFADSAKNIVRCHKLLHFAKSLQMSESSKFIIDTCKYYYGRISQFAAQFLPPPITNVKFNNIHRLYHRHLKDGIQTDAVSGWLLYASYYYVTGQYNVTLKLIEYVLSRCKHGLLVLGCTTYNVNDINSYRQNVHTSITFKDRIKIAAKNDVKYVKHSSLIPEELQVEVEEIGCLIPPVILSYCLGFLCYHHLGDMFNREESLNNLLSAVKDTYNTSKYDVSDSLTILGVCYEILGDKDKAYQCYDEALHNDIYVCRSAKARKAKLLGIEESIV